MYTLTPGSSPQVPPREPVGRWERLRAIHALTRQRAREGQLGVLRQLYEMVRLKLVHDIPAVHYHCAGMWRRDMPWEDKVGYVGGRQYVRALAAANPLPYRKLSQHKLPEKALLTLLGFPTPRFLGVVRRVGGRTASGAPLTTAAELERFLAEHVGERLSFKLMEGHGGHGFLAARVERGPDGCTLAPLAGEAPMSVERFFAEHVERLPNGRLIEAYLDQHPTYAAFNESSVNTLRIVAYAPPDGRARVVGAYLRIGHAGSLVDNRTSGGIVAAVDQATGVVGVATDGAMTRELYRVHPDTGRPIEGVRLPFWAESLALAEAALDAFPKMRFAGLDVAVTPDGPSIIEINNYPGIEGLSSVNIRLATVLRP